MGLHYPTQELVGLPGHYAHHRIAHAIAERDKLLDFDGAKNFLKAVYDETNDGEKVLISAEPLYRHVYPIGSDSSAEGYASYIERVREATSDFDVRILVMLRRQDLFAESLYSEHVLSTSYQKQISDFIQEKSALLDFKSRLSDWAQVFGEENIWVSPFERENLPDGIQKFFVNWLGLEWVEKFQEVRNFNQGLNRTFVEYKRRINFKSQPNNVNTMFRNWLMLASRKQFAEKFSNRNPYFLSPRDRFDLMMEYENDNAEIANKFLNRPKLFERSIDLDVRNFHPDAPLSSKDFEEITKNILRVLAHE